MLVSHSTTAHPAQLERRRDAGVDAGFWSERRVLVTGHTGFKGTWLCLWLGSMGAEVVGYSRGAPSSPSLFELARLGEVVESVKGDVRDGEAMHGLLARHRPEVVIHMAAQPLVRRSLRAPVETYETNVMGTVHLLAAVAATDSVRSAIVVTSDKCYRNHEREWAYREHEPLGGHDPYSASKACAELVTAAYRDSFFAGGRGPALASARAGNVIGGGDWAEDRLIPDFMTAALQGRALRVRNPDSVRPWQHVLCPLSGYLMLAQALSESEEAAQAWNFGPDDSDARPVRWMVERLGELWGEELTWELEVDDGPHEASYLKLDSSRARTRLGWRPGWDLDDALRSIVAWYRGYGEGADVRELTLGQIRDFVEAGGGRLEPQAIARDCGRGGPSG